MTKTGSRPTEYASRRLRREARTLEVMVGMYCRAHHGRARRPSADGQAADGHRSPGAAHRSAPLCPECEELLAYARRRLERCPYGAEKPTCARCPTHCYRPDMREQVRAVMRYSGPRMLRSHPYLALAHLVDGRRTS